MFGQIGIFAYICNEINNHIQMEKTIKYEEALHELEQIVKMMENDELDIDQMGEKLKRAQQLIRLCKDRLTKTDEEIKAILADADNS